MRMKVSNELIEQIKEFEGYSLKAYRDSAGILTIGIGHTGKDVCQGDVISADEAERLFREDIGYAERVINRINDKMMASSGGYGGLTQRQFDALVDLVYNCGETTVRGGSTMGDLLLSGKRSNYPSIQHAFMLWVKITNPKTGKKEVCGGSDGKHGLVLRRAIEAAWYVFGSDWKNELLRHRIVDVVEWARL